MRRRVYLKGIVGAIAGYSLAACAGPAVPAPDPPLAQSPPQTPPTPQPLPTATVAPPTAVPPTPTPEPTATATPVPTATATPVPTATATPQPTATATPRPAVAVYTSDHSYLHHLADHPESPDRVRLPIAALNDSNFPLEWPDVPAVSPELLRAVHTEAMIQAVDSLELSGGGWIDTFTFIAKGSGEAARRAAGATVQAMSDVLQSTQKNAFVVVRPPGHHATARRSMGFCLFNNAAVATHWVLSEQLARRVAILDVDVHHGNGTQEIFYRRPDVLYFSIHQSPLYPYTGAIAEMGAGEGLGSTINVPLPPGCGDPIYGLATEQVLVPAVRRFEPDCILVSLGFDVHWSEPRAQMRMSLQGYATMLEQIVSVADEVCDGRVVFLLEGGYNLQAVQHGVVTAAAVLAGTPPPPDPLGPPGSGREPPGARDILNQVRRAHRLA
jgi:acetoin utilization deacetylase AcuC-like enzyme